MFIHPLIIMLLPLALPVLAADETDPYDAYREQSDYREELETPWVEIETQVRKLPQDDDLVEIELDRLPPGLSLYADLANVSVDDRDRVVRTWLVVRSAQGAYNASYEGFRCSNRQYKVYAYANPRRSKPLRTVEFPSWRNMRAGGYRMELAEDNFCDTTRPLTEHQIRSTLNNSAADFESPY